MPKSRAQLMKALRQSRRDAGLVEFRAWVTPKDQALLAEYLKRLQKKKS